MEPAGHAEMHDERFACREMCNEVLRAALEPLDARAVEASGEILGKWKPKIGTPRRDIRESAAKQDRLEPQSDRFDLGQFRHLSTLLLTPIRG
jgi:hypothetical protein